jgi:putative ABC transport system ATP-binding protein
VPDAVRASGLRKTFATRGPAPVHAVREASLAVGAGETVVVTGPSGSGKTTLLAMLGGLLTPDAGTVLLDGVDLGAADQDVRRALRLRRVGFVFQRGVLLDHLTVRQNVAVVPRAIGRSRRDARAMADALLGDLGLAGRGDDYPHALSAGEAQRVALARALVLGPGLVLADEPTAHLDRANGLGVLAELRTLARERAAGVVVVTHDPALVAGADRTFRLEEGVLRPAAG